MRYIVDPTASPTCSAKRVSLRFFKVSQRQNATTTPDDQYPFPSACARDNRTTSIAQPLFSQRVGRVSDFLYSRIDQRASKRRCRPIRRTPFNYQFLSKKQHRSVCTFYSFIIEVGVDGELVLKRGKKSLGTESTNNSRDRMRLSRVCALLVSCLLAVEHVTSAPSPQEPAFELPVQLIGFPVIIAAVRITNFIKKLAYSLSPQTYANRVRRSIGSSNQDEEVLDIAQVEQKLIAEFGNNVCIYERICAKHAGITMRGDRRQAILDWDVIFSEYKESPNRTKENYLLSVLMGDIVGSPKLCHQLAKRGRECADSALSD